MHKVGKHPLFGELWVAQVIYHLPQWLSKLTRVFGGAAVDLIGG